MPGSRSWLKWCGMGCGGSVLLVTLLLAVFWFAIMIVSDQAVATREILEEAHLTQTEFTPRVDGTIPAERMERFLAVREVLASFCSDFTSHQRFLGQLHRQAREDHKDPPSLDEMSGYPGSLFSLGRDLGKFSVARNEALLRSEMGLGEYTWIFVMAYHGYLRQQPVDFALDPHPRVYGRVRDDVLRMMERRVTALQTALADPDGAGSPRLSESLAAWQAELVALQRDRERLPFQDGLPPELEASLQPFRGRLQDSFCSATSELNIMRTTKSGFHYDHI